MGREKIYTTHVTGEDRPVRGTAKRLADVFEAKGYEAERAKDKVLAQQMWQRAEFYKKEISRNN